MNVHHHVRGHGMASERSRARLVKTLEAEGISNPDVLKAIGKIPRHAFIDEALASRAYDNTALPIGHGQTISQPYIVARMTELLVGQDVLKNVLEVGTGSGYQTAVLAELGITVYTVERLEPLYQSTRQRLRAMGYNRVRCRLSDGSWGLPDYAPFEGIMVTAGGSDIPTPLKAQLCDGGKLVMPVGPANSQRLVVMTRHGNEFEEELLDLVSFVPLISDGREAED